MMKNLSQVYQSDDILSLVFSFLPLASIALIELTNKRFYHLLREDFTDKLIYQEAIIRLFTNDASENVKHQFVEFLKGNNCRELLKEFYIVPFLQDLDFENDADYNSYCNKGGVINFGLYIPCKLLRVLLRLYRDHLYIKRTLHKFLLFSLISEWKFDLNVKFQIGIVEKEIPFYQECYDYNRYPPSTFPFKQYLIEIIKRAEPNEGWVDIFQAASEPPYGLESCVAEVTELTKSLYNDHDGGCEHYCWDDFIGDKRTGIWAAFWISGLEGWGTFSLTTYDYSKERFIITAASATD